jgi:hypothetical protein
MRSFSLSPNSSIDNIEQYCNFLTREVYYHIRNFDINDPLFLQQLGILQAESIRRYINDSNIIAYEGFIETNSTIANSTNSIGERLYSIANRLTSSLEKGFTKLNNSLIKIDSGIGMANTHLSNINNGISITNAHLSNVNIGIQNINNNLFALRNMIGQGFSKLYTQLSMSNTLLENILEELRIPETQKERRYHVEEGAKYLTMALDENNKLYFEDAIDEFNKALVIERKDFFSLFNLGIIYLKSKEHFNISQAISAFDNYIHYAYAESIHKKNINLGYQIDEAHLYLAELYYLQNNYNKAINETEQCLYIKDKADFMKVKYLSVTNENGNKQEAANILSKLMDKNPYISMQVLEDEDILRNDFVVNLLEKYSKKVVQEAESLLKQAKKKIMEKSKFRNDITKLEKLVSTGTYLDSVEVIESFNKNKISEQLSIELESDEYILKATSQNEIRIIYSQINNNAQKCILLVKNLNTPSDILDQIYDKHFSYWKTVQESRSRDELDAEGYPTGQKWYYYEEVEKLFKLDDDILSHRNVSVETIWKCVRSEKWHLIYYKSNFGTLPKELREYVIKQKTNWEEQTKKLRK